MGMFAVFFSHDNLGFRRITEMEFVRRNNCPTIVVFTEITIQIVNEKLLYENVERSDDSNCNWEKANMILFRCK